MFLKEEKRIDHDRILLQSLEMLSDITERKRVRFIFEEISRVRAMIEALQKNNFYQVNTLLTSAQKGLKDHYEVSCKEIDCAASLLQSITDSNEKTGQDLPWLLGPRMMGGGFGGSLILFILKSKKEELEKKVEGVLNEYQAQTQCLPQFFYIRPYSMG